MIRVVGGPWPERWGCTGDIVSPPTPRVYPWRGLGRDEVVVLLHRDPVTRNRKGDVKRGWSCVLSVRNVEKVEEAP